MSAQPTREDLELAGLTPRHADRLTKEGRQRRAQATGKLFRLLRRGIARLSCAAQAGAMARAHWVQERAHQTHT
jgi:hypothetical protein